MNDKEFKRTVALYREIYSAPERLYNNSPVAPDLDSFEIRDKKLLETLISKIEKSSVKSKVVSKYVSDLKQRLDYRESRRRDMYSVHRESRDPDPDYESDAEERFDLKIKARLDDYLSTREQK